MRCGKLLGLSQVFAMAMLLLAPGSAHAQSRVRINKLTDANFGIIANVSIDQQISKNVCLFTTPAGTRYQIRATGGGPGGVFTLSSSSGTLAYEVQWANTTGQTVGTALTPGVALTNLTTLATSSGCTSGPATSASLIIILRTAAISAATAGAYTGTLTLLVEPN